MIRNKYFMPKNIRGIKYDIWVIKKHLICVRYNYLSIELNVYT